jgi:hypothetical protein
MKLVWLIKTCSNEAYGKVRIGKYLSDNFSIQNGLKQGDDLSPLLFNFALEQCCPTYLYIGAHLTDGCGGAGAVWRFQ